MIVLDHALQSLSNTNLGKEKKGSCYLTIKAIGFGCFGSNSS